MNNPRKKRIEWRTDLDEVPVETAPGARFYPLINDILRTDGRKQEKAKSKPNLSHKQLDFS